MGLIFVSSMAHLRHKRALQKGKLMHKLDG